MARCWNPRCRTHTRTRPRAPTNALPRTRAKTSSGSRSAEYVNQLSTSSVLPRALRRAATSARPFRPLSSFFRPLLPRRALALSAAFVFGSPPPLAAAPATGGLCTLWHRRDSPVFQRPTAAPALFNARRISSNCEPRALRRQLRHSRANFSRFFRNEAASFEQVCLAEHKRSYEPSVAAKLLSRKPLPGVVFRSNSTVFASLQPSKDRRSAGQGHSASPKEILQARCERVRRKTLNES